jgi:hypothetical protein
MQQIKKSELVSKSGRKLSDLPKLDFSTNRKCINSLKRFNKWLIEEAKKEVEDDKLGVMWLNHIELDNITKADLDTINLSLFDDFEVEILLNE